MPQCLDPSIDVGELEKKTGFKVNKQMLIDLVEKYRQRKYIDDIDYIQNELQGIDHLLDSMAVSATSGITTASLAVREQAYGHNRKESPTLTPFCHMVLAALDDFMLKLLIVCAVFQIIIDMSFAEPHDRSHAWIEGGGILLAVAIVSLVGAWSDYSKEQQFLKQQLLEENSKVL